MTYKKQLLGSIFFVLCLISCKESIRQPEEVAKKDKKIIQNKEISLIGVGSTSGMMNPSQVKEQVGVIILKDSIFKIKYSANINDTISRSKNDFNGKNIFDLIPSSYYKSQKIGSFGVNDGLDWLISIEFEDKSNVVLKMGRSTVPEALEEFNESLKKIW